MKAKLRVVGGRANRQEIVLSLPTIVGRAKESGLCVRHPTVSRKHCELREEGGLLVVEDLGSSNGIAVGDKLVPRATLQPGDRLTIGPLTFEALYQVNGVRRAATPSGAAGAGVPPLADTEVESDFDFLSDDGGEVALAPVEIDAADELSDGPAAVAPPVEAAPAMDDARDVDDALELDDAFELAPLDSVALDGAPAESPVAEAAGEDVPEEFALPDEIPLDLDEFELSDAAPAEAVAQPGESGLKLHETLEFDLDDEDPAASAPRVSTKQDAAPVAKAPATKTAPEKAATDGDTLDGLDDWLGLSDE